MNENIIQQFCEHVHEMRGAAILDDYLLLDNQLIMVCEQPDYDARKQQAITMMAKYPDRISSVCVFYVGTGSYYENLTIQGKPYYGSNLAWVWQNDLALLFDHDDLGTYIRRTCALSLQTQLQNLQCGEGDEFEILLANILSFTLPCAIAQLEPGVPAFNRARIRDIKLRLQPGCALQQHFQRAGLPSNNLLVEAKNQKKEDNGDIVQIRDYLGERKFASIGLLVTRNPLAPEKRREVMDANRGVNNSSRILIIPLERAHLRELIAKANHGEFQENESFLINEAESWLNANY